MSIQKATNAPSTDAGGVMVRAAQDDRLLQAIVRDVLERRMTAPKDEDPDVTIRQVLMDRKVPMLQHQEMMSAIRCRLIDEKVREFNSQGRIAEPYQVEDTTLRPGITPEGRGMVYGTHSRSKTEREGWMDRWEREHDK